MNEDPFEVIWKCRSNGKTKSFVFNGFSDDKQNNRMAFENTDTDEVLTISGSSYYWIITKPVGYDINKN